MRKFLAVLGLLSLTTMINPTTIRAAERGPSADEVPEQQLKQINAAIGQIEKWLNSAANNRTSQESELRSTTRKIDTTAAAIVESQTSIAALESQLASLSTRSSALEAARSVQQDLVKRALRASYMSGRESYLKVLLNQEDPALSARMLRYYGAFNEARMTEIARFRQTLSELAITVAEMETATQEIASHKSELETQLSSLNADQNSRQALLKELDASIASRSGELQQMEEDRARLEDLIKQIAEAIINIPAPEQLTPFAAARGHLPWPVAGKPLNRFGSTYSDGNLHRQGVVLAAATGAPVRAVHPGRIVFSDWLRGSGLLVIVDHGEGYLSLYANNQSLVKKKGDWVNRGEALATAGANGGMDAPGIYFEIRHNGEAQDPASWCES